jgi:precorrin-8X/cobalt-precorrin-8 methylmutase
VDEEGIAPAMIIGMPVGFVACAESKDELVKRPIPYITISGRRGGSSAAAATVNSMLDLIKVD